MHERSSVASTRPVMHEDRFDVLGSGQRTLLLANLHESDPIADASAAHDP
jgi:hypothetical protein